jgi:RHS repeat-associated protein
MKQDYSPSVSSTLYLHGLPARRSFSEGGNDYPLVEKKSGGVERKYIYGPTGLIVIKDNTSKRYVQKDHLGSTRVLYDESGVAVTVYEYDAYGRCIGRVENTQAQYRFMEIHGFATGQEFEVESGLHNFRARMYDDDLVGFCTTDPANQTYAPYSYCAGNPVMLVDPTGRNYQVDGNDVSDDIYDQFYASEVDQYIYAKQHNENKIRNLFDKIKDKSWQPDFNKPTFFTGKGAKDKAAIWALLHIMSAKGQDAINKREYGTVVVGTPYLEYDGSNTTGYSSSSTILEQSGDDAEIPYTEYKALADKTGGDFAAIVHTHTIGGGENFSPFVPGACRTNSQLWGDMYAATFGNDKDNVSFTGPGTNYLLTPSGAVKKFQFDKELFYMYWTPLHNREDGFEEAFKASMYNMVTTIR